MCRCPAHTRPSAGPSKASKRQRRRARQEDERSSQSPPEPPPEATAAPLLPFSWEYDLTRDLKVDWVTGRNICRRHCMDLVSIETKEVNDYLLRQVGILEVWIGATDWNKEGTWEL